MSDCTLEHPQTAAATELAVERALRLRSRTVGALVMAAFGGLWAIVGAQRPGGGAPADACLVVAAMLLASGLGLLRNHQRPAAPLPSALAERRRRVGRLFLWTSIGEGLGMLVAVSVVVDLGHPQWQAAAVMAVVGLHFLPLAWAFRYRPHLVTGASLGTWALAYPWLFDAGATSAAGPLGAAVLLLASSAWALRSVHLA
ncbi:MAG: hypothetical protein ABJD97_06830 [Betaproteobacteria bacterium]